jgi:hypothetical protein
MTCVDDRLSESPTVCTCLVALFCFAWLGVVACGDEAPGDTLQTRLADTVFTDTVQPFLKTFCLDCHGVQQQESDLNLSLFQSSRDVARAHQIWDIVLDRLEAGEMPPEKAERHPSVAEKQAVIAWFRSLRAEEARRNAGDPGLVPVRRLSNAEYNYAIRDLTGVDIRPTETFPVDPANEAGFDNSGESLTMSPALLNKYLAAARQVVEHLVLKPEGIAFAPHPVVTDTDRDKYCVKRIIQFYERQPTDYSDYFLTAWRFHIRDEGSEASLAQYATLAQCASSHGVSPKYLATIWSALVESEESIGPLSTLQIMWRELPSDIGQLDAARAGCKKMRDYVVDLRQRLSPQFPNLEVEGSNRGSQPFVLWKNRQYAAHRLTYDREALQVDDQAADEADNELAIPSDDEQRARYEMAFERFCRIFPDAMYVSERGRDYLKELRTKEERGRLLSAGFHSMMGYFRDDGPLYDLVLGADEQRELDRLWEELDFVSNAPVRQYVGFLWFERTDSRFMRDPVFDFARAEDKNANSQGMIERLAEVYLGKARDNGGDDVALQAMEDYFHGINGQIRWVERARRSAEPSHLVALLEFAERAYRRPLVQQEQDRMMAFYAMLREQDQLDHEAAMQDSIVAVLMSPHFCYRLDLTAIGKERSPLSDFDLASRLSFFLWSSLPDQELLDLAAAGELHRPEVLAAQTRRMLRAERVRGLATEFGGNWLDFRRFDQHNSVDRERFSSFTDELRQAMFAEPIRLLVHLLQNDGSVLDLVEADYTFVNRVLAEHYGMTDVTIGPQQWRRVDAVARYGRGGLLPMSVFLTANSPGLRTSPVKRGYWVVRRLLGERIPPPPPNVPELPADESKLGELTLREMLARHRDHTSCAECHVRFDAIGLVFESYGPIGEQRDKDLGGRTVITSATFPDGINRTGVAGLQDYVREQRQEDFLENFCRKLLSYALGRTLQLSDDGLLQELQEVLQTRDNRVEGVVERIVTSPQFRNKRSRD